VTLDFSDPRAVLDEMAVELGVRRRVPFKVMQQSLSIRKRPRSSLPGAEDSAGYDVSIDDFAHGGHTWHVFYNEAAARDLAIAQARWQFSRLGRGEFWRQWRAEGLSDVTPSGHIVNVRPRRRARLGGRENRQETVGILLDNIDENAKQSPKDITALAKHIVERYGVPNVVSITAAEWTRHVPAYGTPHGLYYWERRH
jgi:hypothetical protein